MPTLPTLKKIERAVESLKNGASVVKACAEAGINRSTFYDWSNSDPKNKERIEKAFDARSNTVVDALYKNALEGNVTAQIFWLKNREPEKWMDRQDVKYSGGITIQAVRFDKDEQEIKVLPKVVNE